MPPPPPPPPPSPQNNPINLRCLHRVDSITEEYEQLTFISWLDVCVMSSTVYSVNPQRCSSASFYCPLLWLTARECGGTATVTLATVTSRVSGLICQNKGLWLISPRRLPIKNNIHMMQYTLTYSKWGWKITLAICLISVIFHVCTSRPEACNILSPNINTHRVVLHSLAYLLYLPWSYRVTCYFKPLHF